MKSILLTLFIIPLFLVPKTNNTETTNEAIVVLELFTSQGCSSCPPADRILNEVKNDKIIALSYHVDYWNYIGWDDPFSNASYTNRQQQYGSKFNSSTIYTPQLVINGLEHIVGSNRGLLKDKINKYSQQSNSNSIALSDLSKSNDFAQFEYKINGDLSDKYIRTIVVINERKTSVKRGENRNRELLNSNIVVNEKRFKIEENQGKGRIRIPEIVEASDDLTLIVIIENSDLDITGASQLAL